MGRGLVDKIVMVFIFRAPLFLVSGHPRPKPHCLKINPFIGLSLHIHQSPNLTAS